MKLNSQLHFAQVILLAIYKYPIYSLVEQRSFYNATLSYDKSFIIKNNSLSHCDYNKSILFFFYNYIENEVNIVFFNLY